MSLGSSQKKPKQNPKPKTFLLWGNSTNQCTTKPLFSYEQNTEKTDLLKWNYRWSHKHVPFKPHGSDHFKLFVKIKCNPIKTSLHWRYHCLLILWCLVSSRKAGGPEKHHFNSQQVKSSVLTGTKAGKYLESAKVAFGVNHQEILLTGLPRCDNGVICDKLLLYVWSKKFFTLIENRKNVEHRVRQ